MKQHPTIRECLGTPLLPAHVMTPLDTCMYYHSCIFYSITPAEAGGDRTPGGTREPFI